VVEGTRVREEGVEVVEVVNAGRRRRETV